MQHTITCGHCQESHYTSSQVRACSTGDLRKGEQYLHGQYVGGYGYDDDACSGPVTVFYVGKQWPCEAHVLIYTEDGQASAPCGAPRAKVAPGEDRCEAGHDYVDLETRREQSWDYCHDEGEARNLAAVGVEPRDMEGRIWLHR